MAGDLQTYNIQGVDRSSGERVECSLQAFAETEARRMAENAGINVLRVTHSGGSRGGSGVASEKRSAVPPKPPRPQGMHEQGPRLAKPDRSNPREGTQSDLFDILIDFMMFKILITPWVIRIVFLLFVLFVLLSVVSLAVASLVPQGSSPPQVGSPSLAEGMLDPLPDWVHDIPIAAMLAIYAVIWLVFVRVLFEVAIVLFVINENIMRKNK